MDNSISSHAFPRSPWLSSLTFFFRIRRRWYQHNERMLHRAKTRHPSQLGRCSVNSVLIWSPSGVHLVMTWKSPSLAEVRPRLHVPATACLVVCAIFAPIKGRRSTSDQYSDDHAQDGLSLRPPRLLDVLFRDESEARECSKGESATCFPS